MRLFCSVAFGLILVATAVRGQDAIKLDGAKATQAAESNKNDLISLPVDQKVPSSQRAVIIVAETQGQDVEWIVLNSNPQAPISSLQLATSKTLIVFPNDQNDTIVVYAYTQVNGKLSKPARHLCDVVKSDPNPTPTPGPGPGPNPAPGPQPAKARVKHVTFVIDQSTQTPDSASVTTDPGLRKFISDLGAKTHTVSVNSTSVTKGGLNIGVQTAGGTPCIILQDDAGNITAAARIINVAAAQAFIDQNQGK